MRVLAALALFSSVAHAQSVVPFASVWSDSSAVVVTSNADSVWILVATPWKSYTAHGDSISVAAFADTAAFGAASFTDASGTALRVSRPAGDPHAPYVLTATAPGSRSSIAFTPDSARRLFSVLEGHFRTVFLPMTPSQIADMPDFTPESPRLDTMKFQPEVMAQAVPGSRPPRYPDILLRQRITGVVLAQYVVDTTGHAVMSTVKMLKSPHPLFSFAVYEGLAKMRFMPGTIGGRKVPELVQEPFTFGR